MWIRDHHHQPHLFSYFTYLFIQVRDEQHVRDASQGRLRLAVHLARRGQRKGAQAGQPASVRAGRQGAETQEWRQHALCGQAIHWKGRDYQLLGAFLVVVICPGVCVECAQSGRSTPRHNRWWWARVVGGW